jgi:predicted N-formylglutamate amidohydrolase
VTTQLLDPDEPPAFQFLPSEGSSPFVFIGDHAGRRLPRRLGDLGVSESDLASHIAWDIGIRGVAERLARTLGAYLAVQNYSRLSIDCNRPLDASDSIVTRSAGVDIPGNVGLSAEAREQRIAEIFRPYHAAIEAELECRARVGRSTVLVAMHSFTPVYMGRPRPWHVGVLFNRDARLARVLLERLARDPSLVVGENQPYAVSDVSDYSIVTYGERRGLPHVEIEIRQDLIADADAQRVWAERLARLLLESLERLDVPR